MPQLRKALPLALLSAALFLLCGVSAAAADLGVGTVNTDGLRLRAEAATDSAILSTANTGERVVVLEDAGDGWYKVARGSVEGYMSSQYVDLALTAEADLGYGKVNTDGSTLNLRSGPGTDYERVAILADDTVVELIGMDNGWFKVTVDDVTGYASSDYITLCPSGGESSTIVSSLGDQIIAYAKQFLGRPYVWGGNGPNSFDCSGFTKYVYSHFGYSINRTASAQLKNGVSVTRDQLQTGDLVFFYNGKVSTPVSHVGIYIGNGDFIHASSNSYTVEISSLYAKNYDQKYVYARRII